MQRAGLPLFEKIYEELKRVSTPMRVEDKLSSHVGVGVNIRRVPRDIVK
jgi:hypothetical protein